MVKRISKQVKLQALRFAAATLRRAQADADAGVARAQLHFDPMAARSAVAAAVQAFTPTPAPAASSKTASHDEDFGSFASFETAPGVAFDDPSALAALPDFLALHIDSLVATACSAATFTVATLKIDRALRFLE